MPSSYTTAPVSASLRVLTSTKSSCFSSIFLPSPSFSFLWSPSSASSCGLRDGSWSWCPCFFSFFFSWWPCFSWWCLCGSSGSGGTPGSMVSSELAGSMIGSLPSGETSPKTVAAHAWPVASPPRKRQAAAATRWRHGVSTAPEACISTMVGRTRAKAKIKWSASPSSLKEERSKFSTVVVPATTTTASASCARRRAAATSSPAEARTSMFASRARRAMPSSAVSTSAACTWPEPPPE
mmetsp:Transcript_88163/g.228714  ORF Transcript_88163/g.228714 Transcript_88163/m.228714 type:complete len:238 (+) Transcript_88163:176-889(+)